jgi:hypothetical protein
MSRRASSFSRLAVGLAFAACGRIGFDSVPDPTTDGMPGGPADAAAPTMHVTSSGVVDPAGLVNVGNQADGTHLVFVDNTPGANGDLVIFRVGDNTTTLDTYVSTDHGATWQRYVVSPTNTSGINDMGACQDTETHAFHVSWLDTSVADQYMRLVPTHTGGDITGFTIATSFGFFDEGADSPGPRDLAEVIDGAGNHRLLFTGTGRFSGNVGLDKLAVTSLAAGLAPASMNDWGPATGGSGSDDQLLPNNYTTADTTSTFMVSTSSNVASAGSGAVVVVAGFPADQKLLAWTVVPAGDAFTVGTAQTLSTAFGAGTGARADASLSVASAPSGDVWIAYSENAESPAPGVHVAKFDRSGTLELDAAAQPTTSTAARHVVIATDAGSRPAVLYADGSGSILGTLLWDGVWLATAIVDERSTPDAAWSISTPWGSDDAFGYYRDAGSANPTTFSQIEWQ